MYSIMYFALYIMRNTLYVMHYFMYNVIIGYIMGYY